MSNPWMKFYPSDWRAEPSLRAVSLAARGFWMEMLCIMHEASPRGHLLLNGQPMTDSQLAAIAGVPLDIAQALLGELESAGTFSRTRAGVIYSRRMRADTALSAKQRANVEKRWVKSSKSTHTEPVENTKKNSRRITKRDTERIPKKPESRIYNSDPNGSAVPASRFGEEPSDPNAEAWRRGVAVLVRQGRMTEPRARSLFGRLLSENGLMGRDLLPSIITAEQIGTGDPGSYLTKAARGVAQRRGLVEPTLADRIASWGPDEWAAAARVYRDTGRWSPEMGPRPGEPGCRAPVEREAA